MEKNKAPTPDTQAPQDAQQPETGLTPAENKAMTASKRFTDMIMLQYSGATGNYRFTDRESQLIKGYFVVIDETLRKAEAERIRKNANNKNHDYDNNIPYNWNTIDLPQLALDLAHYARIGLDMQQDNHLFPIPYADKKAGRYTITLMEGYNGIRYQAEKYAINPPKNVTVEVVFSNDRFQPIKKSRDQPCDTYTFEIPNPFDRGQPVGAFGYIEYDDETKNTLVVMSKADIEKRKPQYASAEFWGGTKKAWENGKQVEVEMAGWLPEMYEKTMKREIYSAKRIPRDPMKIDENYLYIRQREAQYASIAAESEAIQYANTVEMIIEDDTPGLPDAPQGLPEPLNQPQEQPENQAEEEAPAPRATTDKAQKATKAKQESFTDDDASPWQEEPDF